MNYLNGTIAALVVMVIAFVVWQNLDRTPEPPFTTISTSNNISVRQYPPLMAAQVEMEGAREVAANNGFKILADYIFGNNEQKQKIGMTAPVIEQGLQRSAVASQQKLSADKWLIQFYLPSNFTLDTLPKPNNQQIKIKILPAKKYVVIKFSGRDDDENLQQHLDELNQFIEQNDVKVKGEPLFGFYNPPWTIPFFRHNEIMYEMIDR